MQYQKFQAGQLDGNLLRQEAMGEDVEVRLRQ